MKKKVFFANWTRLKTLYMFLILAGLTGPLLHSVQLIPSMNIMFFNFTRSAPVGMYLSCFDQKVSNGDYVIVSPPENAKHYLYDRHWTVSSFLLKHVAALPGEQYEIRKPWLVIGDKEAYIFTEDSDGLPMQALPNGVYTVPAGKALLVSFDVPRSFDSRYFGPVDQSLIVRKVVPGIVLPPLLENWLLGKF